MRSTRESDSQAQGLPGKPKFTLLHAWPEAAEPGDLGEPWELAQQVLTWKESSYITSETSICHLLSLTS